MTISTFPETDLNTGKPLLRSVVPPRLQLKECRIFHSFAGGFSFPKISLAGIRFLIFTNQVHFFSTYYRIDPSSDQ